MFKLLIYAILESLSFSEKAKIKYKQKKIKYYERTWFYKINAIMDYLYYFKAYLQFKQRYDIEIPAEACGQGHIFKLVTICLADILYPTISGEAIPLTKTKQYKTLIENDDKIYLDFLNNANITNQNLAYSVSRFRLLQKELLQKGYNPQKSAIVINENNILLDGAHRCAILLAENLQEEITAIKVYRH